MENASSLKAVSKKETSNSSGNYVYFDQTKQALENTGRCYSWGWNEAGQLGVYNERRTPGEISSLRGERVSNLSGGLSHSILLTESGRVYACGKGKYGRLGNGSEMDWRIPTLISFPTKKRVVQIACGSFHSAIIAVKGELWTWGRGDSGQLGLGGTENALVPSQVLALKDSKVVHVACGSNHTLIVTEKNQLFVCGKGEKGELGLSSPPPSQPIILPTPIDLREASGNRIVSIACGSNFSAAVIGPDVYTWGFNDKGQLGLGHLNNVDVPTIVQELKNKKQVIIQVSCGVSHCAVLNNHGEIFTWGNGSNGELGLGSVSEVSLSKDSILREPRRVKEALFKKKIIHISCGSYHTSVLTSEGEVYTWGLNDYGQIGNGETGKVYSPYFVRGPLQGQRVLDVHCGGRHTLAATAFRPLIHVMDSNLHKDMQSYINRAEFSDIILEFPVDSKQIHAHKIILSRCSKFQKIFDNSPNLKQYQINDVAFSIFKALLDYLYFDNLSSDSIPSSKEQLEAFTVQLMQVSEMYGAPLFQSSLEYHLQVGTNFTPLRDCVPQSFGFDMKQYINNPLFSDIRFNVEGTVIYAHKVILAARSEYFKALFTSQFKESFEQVIELTDIRQSVFLSLLEYIYTDSILNIKEDDAVELMTLANEYYLERLKQECESFISEGVDIENAAWLFELCDRYDAQQLKSFCFYFILSEFEAVSKTEAFQQLSPDVLEQISRISKTNEKDKKKDKKDKEKCSIN